MDTTTNTWSKLHDFYLVGEQFITPGIDPLTRRSGSQQEMVGAWCLSPRGGRQARSGGWQIGLGLRYCALSQGGWRGGGKTEEGAVLWSGILLVWVKERGGGTLGQHWLLKQFCLNHPVEHIQEPKLPKLYVRVETSTSYFIIHNQFVK